jgi:hypothetical protein
MTTLEVKLDLSDRLAREAQAAGLLTPKALGELLKDAMQRRAARACAARGRGTCHRSGLQAAVDEGNSSRGQRGASRATRRERIGRLKFQA